MSEFLDNIRKWHSDAPASIRGTVVRDEINRLKKKLPSLANFILFLDNVNAKALTEPHYGAYYPPNMADLFESLSITSWQQLDAYISSTVFEKFVECLIPVKFKVDRKIYLPVVTTAELEQLIKEQCNVLPDIDFKWGDARYWLCPDHVLEEVLRYTSIDREPYSEAIIKGGMKYVHDCDNFAMDLAGRFSHPDLSGLAFGQVWLQAKDVKTNKVAFSHAINIAINEEKKVRLIEPQNDKIYNDPKGVVNVVGQQVKYYLYFLMMV